MNTSRSAKVMGARSERRSVSAKVVMRSGSRSDKRIRPNWSPEMRASVSCGFMRRIMRRATVSRMESAMAMPTERFTCLKRSRSMNMTVGFSVSSMRAKVRA